MSISLEDVKRVANLARMDLDDAEANKLTEDLSKILDFAASIQELDTDDVPPTTHCIEFANVLRADEVRPSVDRDEALGQAPKADDECFVAPRII